MLIRFLLVPFLLVGATVGERLSAQVSVSLTALTPIALTAVDGPTTDSITQPAGPLPSSLFNLSSNVGTSAVASFQSDVFANSTEAYCVAGIACSNATATATTAANNFELLATFSAVTPTPVRFRVEFDLLLPPGAIAPQASVDVDNDGSIDYVNGTQLVFFGPRVLGPQTLQFRIILNGSLQQAGLLVNDLRVVVTPDNDLAIDPAVVGCANSGPSIAPSFLGRGITIADQLPGTALKVFVLGLQTQPVILPSPSSQPCLLLPRPDLTVLMGSFGSMQLALPQSVRPVTIWIQTVELQGGMLLTGFGSRVGAN